MATSISDRLRVPNRAGGWITLRTPALWVLLVLAALAFWLASAKTVTITVDGMAQQMTTHRRTVGALLIDAGLLLNKHDRVTPALDAALAQNGAITVVRARPYQIVADGRVFQTASWGTSAQEVLQDAAIGVDPYDRVRVNGVYAALGAQLPVAEREHLPATYQRDGVWSGMRVEPVQLQLERAVPITIDEGGLPYELRTTAQTVGEALRQADVLVYLGDRVDPRLGSEVVPGLRVRIQRSIPVTVHVDGRFVKTRTRASTVGGALAELKVGLIGMDQVDPPVSADLLDGMNIAITRLREDIAVEEEIVPFETVYVPDPNLPIDTQELAHAGAEGITRQRYRVAYVDGQEVSQTLEDSWVAQEPAERQIAYGQKIEAQSITGADGRAVTYWRHIRMYATSYSAGTAGVSTSSPTFGRTFTGDIMRQGIVAVDPRIIPLHSQVYIPGYGIGDALDTGSAIRARIIDLGYEDATLTTWNRWVDVYLLWPPPPDYQITWVLPNYPRLPE